MKSRQAWKDNFPAFWPKGNRFYTPLTGIAPGEVALVSLAAGPMKLSTGVMVLYADEESFTLMTPQGHMLAGWITFSAFEAEGGNVAQAQVLMRPDLVGDSVKRADAKDDPARQSLILECLHGCPAPSPLTVP